MALSDILVCVDSTEAGEGRLKLGLRFARQHSAYLTAAYVLDSAHRPLFTDAVTDDAARAERAEEEFHEALRLNSIEGSWRLIDGPDVAAVVTLAKSVDLAIIGQYSRERHNGTGFRPEQVAMDCGRPLLIVPYVGEFPAVGEHVLIAWDGTRE